MRARLVFEASWAILAYVQSWLVPAMVSVVKILPGFLPRSVSSNSTLELIALRSGDSMGILSFSNSQVSMDLSEVAAIFEQERRWSS